MKGTRHHGLRLSQMGPWSPPWSPKEKTGNIKRWIEPISRISPGLGQITWWIVCWQNGLSPETITNAQRILFVSLGIPWYQIAWYPLVPNCWSSQHGITWYQIVGAPRTVSNRESRYTRPTLTVGDTLTVGENSMTNSSLNERIWQVQNTTSCQNFDTINLKLNCISTAPGGAVLNNDLRYKFKGTCYNLKFLRNACWNHNFLPKVVHTFVQKFQAFSVSPSHAWVQRNSFPKLSNFPWYFTRVGKFRGEANVEKHADPGKKNRNIQKSREYSRNLLKAFLRSRKKENLYGQCDEAFWQKSGNDRAFFFVGCKLRSARFEMRRQPQKFENLTLVACRRQHFRVFCMSFFVYLLSLKQGVWSWQQTISLLELTHKYSRRSHLNIPSRKTQ